MIDLETGEIIISDHTRPFIRSRYNYDTRAASEATALHCPEPTLAQQGDRDDADINTLVRRFGVTGQIPMLNQEALDPNTFHDITSFHDAANAIKASRTEFMKLPAELRQRFRNDPHEFLAFVHDDKNREEAKKLGILKEKPSTTPPGAPVAGATPPAPVTPPGPPAAA